VELKPKMNNSLVNVLSRPRKCSLRSTCKRSLNQWRRSNAILKIINIYIESLERSAWPAVLAQSQRCLLFGA
jgi:hypothetical protein